MLQEATKVINSAFNQSFIKKLSQYLHDCVREEVKSSTFRNLKGDKDNKWIFLKREEELFTNAAEYISLDGADSKITELMIQSDLGSKDKYLIYGYLFLVGKSSKTKKHNEFLTPLLYMPCRLERNGVNINCFPLDEVLSLNTGALAALMRKSDDDDEVDLLLEGILDVVPDLSITQEKLSIFLTTLKSLIPEIEISTNIADYNEEDNVSKDFYKTEKIDGENAGDIVEEEQTAQKQSVKLEKIAVTYQSAIILTKRPAVTAGVLHELTRIAEQPSGIYRETALNIINEEYAQSKGKSVTLPDIKHLPDFYPITPLSLSDSQEQVIKNIESSKFIAVQGPPGTGKSQTIVNLAAHMIANGKTVIVASRMDKAVDVVAERLNEMGSHMALRAGRLNYQRQLSNELNNLLSDSGYLDEDAEDILFADNKDMKNHLDAVKEAENKCEKIIKLEKDWHNKFTEVEEARKLLGEAQFIKNSLRKHEIDMIGGIIKILERNLEKAGIFTRIANFTSLFQLKRTLKLKSFDTANLSRLKEELSLASLSRRLNKIESEIQKTGNLHVLSEQIHGMKTKQSSLAVNILKKRRREALKILLRDVNKRNRLKIHAKALVTSRRRLQSSILEEEDFRPLLEAFPCWCTTTYAVSDSLPLKPGMFDVAIIDEASQCDIASCFPVLFRAKKAIIVGDDKQLPHLSFLEKAKEQSFLSQYSIPDKYRLMWSFRTNSMFDLADYYSMSSVMLDEHFRSLPPIINFSNSEFYNTRMRIMKKDVSGEKAVETVYVPEGKVDFDATRNLPEIEALVKRLYDIIVEDERKNPDNPVSIGIISPFRAQVEQLKISVTRVLSDYMIKKHQIEIGTAHTFQGDERDIILISWAFAENSYAQSLIFLQKPNLFNVAITRGRQKVINFISKNPRELPQGHFRNYLSYIQEYENRLHAVLNSEIDENIYKNRLEKEIAAQIRELGHDVKAGVEIAGFSVDLLVDNKVVVEIDGVEDSRVCTAPDMKKQSILERCGCKVNRITFREWQYSPKACLDRVLVDVTA
ncbi:MAG: AAA family ATPase [Heliobacteriaceae bacterium]|jgi:superfamily I DNA and/or RNA helicase/very-short-patch-repair endonuclease|nr:AAA family ATPase [Heliobacteriaceae bacterium]